MGRSRVLSFMSAFGGPPRSPTSSSSPANTPAQNQESQSSSVPAQVTSSPRDSPINPKTRVERIERAVSRPVSMVQTYQPPLMEVAQGTPPELQPIFTYLNSHSNKLYQEGYFLKLNDLDVYGRPNVDRTWTECFAQLVGTVLSLWDAAALDAAGQDGEVPPTFINLADASIKMIETLPTRTQNVQPLQNVLSISTAGKNRFLLHFNSLHSLTQWTAGIRLSMFEHSSLQEAYTGSLIAGKGKGLNNIRAIMDRTKVKHEDWARVRFGAGTPWRRCWCVISPADEKEVKKLNKKRTAYERPSFLKGDIKFYDTKKTKKATPIATISDAYSAYAIYPQSKPLIDASTLVKVEGTITIHSSPESSTEGFVFVMPEVHPAVSGFEMMLRWLFPVFDIFGLYGRPNKLVADTLDSRGMMFAMPKDRRYGYLEILDVAALIHSDGGQSWSEREWRKQLKDATSRRMNSEISRQGSRIGSRMGSRRGPRTSLPSRNGTLRFDDDASIRSSPSVRYDNHSTDAVFSPPPKTATAPPGGVPFPPPHNYHARSVSETVGFSTPQRQRTEPFAPSRLSYEANETDYESTPPPPPHHGGVPYRNGVRHGDLDGSNDRSSSDSDRKPSQMEPDPQEIRQELRPNSPPAPVVAPPAFSHQPGDRPQTRPNQAPELRRENSRMSSATLSQLVDAGRLNDRSVTAAAGAAAAWKGQQGRGEDNGQRGVNDYTSAQNTRGTPADQSPAFEAMVAGQQAADDSSNRAPPVPVHRSPLPSASHISDPSQQYSNDIPSKSSLSPASRPDGPARIDTGKGVVRKPVPHAQAAHDTDSPAAESLGSLRQNLDQDALDRVIARETTRSSDDAPLRQSDDTNYNDLSSPDYASTRKSTDTNHSIPKSRTGVLKTVGTVEPANNDVLVGDARYGLGGSNNQDTPSIPNVDFGPTQQYAPASKSRPSTSGTIGQLTHDRTPSDSLTPKDEKRYSYGRGSPGNPHSSRGHSRSPSGDDRRNLAWSPGAAVVGGRSSPGGRITPEQFVQQRAEASRSSTPGYPHQRSYPGNIMNHRNASGDLTHSRQTLLAKDLPPRPHSRGAQTNLQSTDISSHLSAREQEHISKMTGQPLISVAGNPKPQPQGSGLVGAIAAREKEKKEMKDGLSSQMVQQAIAQRQQQVQPRQYHFHQQQNHVPQGYPQHQFGGWSSPQQQIGQPQWVSPAPQAYWSPLQQQNSSQGRAPAYQHPQSPFQQSPQPMTPQGQQQQQYGGFYGNQYQGR